MQDLVEIAVNHVRDILSLALLHTPEHASLVIFDSMSTLSKTLTEAYKRILPDAAFMDFNTITSEEIFAAFKQLSPFDLVVLIQSTNFRLNDFRIRVELFEQSLKVIEHPHL